MNEILYFQGGVMRLLKGFVIIILVKTATIFSMCDPMSEAAGDPSGIPSSKLPPLMIPSTGDPLFDNANTAKQLLESQRSTAELLGVEAKLNKAIEFLHKNAFSQAIAALQGIYVGSRDSRADTLHSKINQALDLIDPTRIDEF